MSAQRIPTCCRSTPRCRTCPVLLGAQARNSASPRAPASLFEEIYRPAHPSLPEQVNDALVALSQARERYRLQHAAAQRPAGS